MKKIYIKIVVLICIICIISIIREKYTEQKEMKETKAYIVTVQNDQQTIKIPLEEYLIGVLAGEMPANFEIEALKAQAVASRTFVMSRQLKVDNTTKSQVYLDQNKMKERWKGKYIEYVEKVKDAISQTQGEVMTYNGKYISALFFSSSNGKTTKSSDYFEGKVDYLQSVDSHWDLAVDPHNKRIVTYTKEQLSKYFHTKSTDMNILSYTESGYVKEISIHNKIYSGREVREKLKLASSSFQIDLTSKGYRFTTYGNGHGVGMSQYGAQGMAKEGKNYIDILNHYYQNIKIESIE